MLCSMLGENVDDYDDCETLEDFLFRLYNCGDLNIPGERLIYLIPERTAIMAAIAKPNSSWLIRALQDRPDDVALVLDSINTGKNALHFVCLVYNHDMVMDWLRCFPACRMSMTIRPVDDDYCVLVAPISSLTNRPA